MNKNLRFNKVILTLFLLLGLAGMMKVNAYSFIKNGIAYDIISGTTTVEVVYNPNGVSGSVSIPTTVSYNSTTYTVVGIYTNAFAEQHISSINIPSTVTYIKGSAFYDTDITNLTIPSSVTSLGEGVCSECTNLSSVILGSGITSIPARTFDGCTSLTSVLINGTISSIGEYAFRGCHLSSYSIPNSVTTLSTGAFMSCTSLTSVTLGTGMTSIPESAFEGCSALSSITINGTISSIGSYAFKGCSNLSSFPIPNSITSISAGVFQNSGLTAITIPATVTSIGSRAFDGCSHVTAMSVSAVTPPTLGSYAFLNVPKNIPVAIPCASIGLYGTTSGWNEFTNYSDGNCILEFVDPNVKTICVSNWDTNNDGALSYAEAFAVTDLGDSFKNKTNITSFDELSFFLGLTSIPSQAFRWCSNLTSVTIPQTVTSIGDYAFASCSKLTSITLGSSVNTIGSSAFNYCDNLSSVYYTGDIAQWCGISFSGSSSNPLSYSHNLYIDNQLVTSLVIPNSVTSIKDYAFYGCSCINSLTIPSSVTSIGSNAIYGCTGLTSITVASGNPIYDSRNNCNAIIKTNINELILGFKTTIIPSSVTSIGNGAFNGCTGLTSITIPNSVTSIGSSAFYRCTGLTSFTIPNSVTSIDYEAFYGCTGLTSFTIPNSVTSISSSAFSGCTGLTSFTIPNSVTSIGYGAFYGCTGLTSITIPNSVTSIGSSAFYRCTGLTSFTIPNSVTSIGSDAFKNCSELTSITLGNSVNTIGSSAFENCNKLSSVYYTGDIAQWCGISFSGGASNPLVYSHNLYIDNQLVTSLVIPKSVTSIKDHAFEGCSCLNSLTIPSSMTSIGSYAFSGCTGLTTVYSSAWPVPSLGFSNPFSDQTTSNAVLYVPTMAVSAYINNYYWQFTHVVGAEFDDVATFAAVCPTGQTLYYHILNETDNVEVIAPGGYNWTGYTAPAGSVTIPEKVIYNSKEYTVTELSNYTFNGCSELESLSVPNSVYYVGYNVMKDTKWYNDHQDGILYMSGVCFGYKGTAPSGNLVIENGTKIIANQALAYCNSLTSVVIPNSVIEICPGAFYGSRFTQVTIGNSVRVLRNGVFSSTRLVSVTIPNSVTVIEDGAFYSCDQLESITIPNSVTTIGTISYEDVQGAFQNCISLKEVIIPNSVILIGDKTFYGNPLESLTIGESVSSIGKKLVDYSSQLTSLTINATTPPTIYDDALYSATMNSGITVNLPCGTLSDYQNAPIWSDFTNLQDGSFEIAASANNIEYGTVEGADRYCSSESCTLTATPATYYRFVNWTEGGNVVSTNASYTFAVTGARTLVANFEMEGVHFTTAGNWNNSANWLGNALPGSSDNVTIHANCNLNQNATVTSLTIDGGVLTIKSGCILKVTGTLTNATAANLVVEDGGQLITNSAVAVTMQKRITAATHWGDQTTPYTPDGWYFIATPMSSITVESAATNLHTYSATGYDYDLYQFNQAANHKEWQNYKTMDGANHANFSTLENGHGYLFASNTSFTLSFAGTLVNNPAAITLKNEGNTYELAGYNLIGNPYPCKATLSVAMPFYRLQNGSEVVDPTAAGSIIDPLEGILVHVDANTEITFNKVEPSNAIAPNNSGLNISLNKATRNPRTVDHAILSFGTSGDLPKFYFNDTEATISLLQEKNEFAVAHSSAQGEMPLNFKARTNGTYTITIDPEDVEVYYLHLIDNITGADIDLLQTPSYTFTARNDDYMSRFRLVFSAKSNGEENGDDDFAFISNGNIIVAGEGTLQVFDVTGRMISSNSVSRNISTNGLSAGVYMLRLVNNDNVKVQKIVVR